MILLILLRQNSQEGFCEEVFNQLENDQRVVNLQYNQVAPKVKQLFLKPLLDAEKAAIIKQRTAQKRCHEIPDESKAVRQKLAQLKTDLEKVKGQIDEGEKKQEALKLEHREQRQIIIDMVPPPLESGPESDNENETEDGEIPDSSQS